MNPLFYVARFIYHLRYWLLILPIIVAFLIFWFTRDQKLEYQVETSIYTGVISGGNKIINDPESSTSSVQNAKIENMITIITSSSTLKKVSIRLFATCMIYGDAQKDNTYIKTSIYKELSSRTPEEVKKLIDKSSLDKTVDNLLQYGEKDATNFVYGLFNWNDSHFSYSALSNISVKRVGFSDILKISYSSDDPGIAYNTLKILNEEFVEQYDDLRFVGTNDMIEFFRTELKRVGNDLTKSEDELTQYNVQNKIINYGEQTKQLTAVYRDFILEYEDNKLKYQGSKSLVDNLEKRIGDNLKKLKSNSEFLNKLNEISKLNSTITQMKVFGGDSIQNIKKLETYSRQLKKEEENFKSFAEAQYTHSFTKEGIPNEGLIKQWLEGVLKMEEYSSQKKVLDKWQDEINDRYKFYSPIGATLKRKEREINFTEASYLATLKGLHDALMRQKSMEMTSSTLKVITPPSFPLVAKPTKRKVTIIAGYIGSIIFVLFFFILIEFLDQTLRDKLRTERITGQRVIGAFPSYSLLKNKGYEEEQKNLAIRQLSNSLTNYFVDTSHQIINMLSLEAEEGKTEIAKYLTAYWESQGLKVKRVDWRVDLITKKRELILSKNIKDIVEFDDEDIILIEYPALKIQSLSTSLLEKATFNLLITRANRTWKETDRTMLDYLVKNVKETPLMIELNDTRISVVEEFTGLLPPYPKLRKIGYRFLHLGLTSKEKIE